MGEKREDDKARVTFLGGGGRDKIKMRSVGKGSYTGRWG